MPTGTPGPWTELHVNEGEPQHPGPLVSQSWPLPMHIVQVGLDPPIPSQEIGREAVVQGQSLSLVQGRWHRHANDVGAPRMAIHEVPDSQRSVRSGRGGETEGFEQTCPSR